MISRPLFDAYSTALRTNDAMASRELLEFIDYVGFSNYAALRDALLDAFPALVSKYGDRAAQVALEFYQAQRASSGIEEAYEPALVAEAEASVARSDVRRSMKTLYDGGTRQAFESVMLGYMTKRVMGQADEQLWEAMERDMVQGKACLVPHPGACGWCVLIASRGWDLEHRIENMRHDHCKCTLVVDWGDPALDGYDEMDYYRIYKDADTKENVSKWLSEWEAMSDEQKAKYAPGAYRDKKSGQMVMKSGWDNYRRNRTIQTMNANMKASSSSSGSSNLFGRQSDSSKSDDWRGKVYGGSSGGSGGGGGYHPNSAFFEDDDGDKKPKKVFYGSNMYEQVVLPASEYSRVMAARQWVDNTDGFDIVTTADAVYTILTIDADPHIIGKMPIDIDIE